MLEDNFKNAFYRYNNGLAQLIIINVAIFIVMSILFVLGQWFGFTEAVDFIDRNLLALPVDFSGVITHPWTLITYAFNHSRYDIGHILYNMIGPYWFGKLFVEYLGSDKLIAVYVLGALAGATTTLLAFNLIPDPPAFLTGAKYMVGASAAVFAVMVATATLLPEHSFYLLFLGPVKIKYIAAFYIFGSLIGTVGSNAGGDIAHLGGALIGFIYTKQLQAGVNWGSWITITLQWFKDLFKPRPKVKVSYRSDRQEQKKSGGKSHISQAELDAILDKISAGGYESLSKDEKEKLFNASKK